MSCTTVPCIVCQCKVNSSTTAPCVKGHHQCDICSYRLNGRCRICLMSAELNNNSDEAEELLSMISSTSLTCSEVQILEQESEETIVANTNDITEYYENMLDTVQSESTSKTKTYDFEEENLCVSTWSDKTDTTSYVSASLMEILKNLHENKCPRSCTTFDYCIRQFLFQQFDYDQEFNSVNIVDGSRSSISDLLGNIHIASCGLECNDMEQCLSSILNRLIKEKVSNAKERLNNSYQTIQDESKSIIITKKQNLKCSEDHVKNKHTTPTTPTTPIDEDSNIVRACYQNHNDFSLPQFEVVNSLSTNLTNAMKIDFSLPFCYESNSKSACIIECPLQQCNVSIEDRYLLTHFLEQHKRYELQTLLPNECKLFFIDPSILDINEVSCIASYRIPKIFQSSGEPQLINESLPVFIMACRANLKNLKNLQVQLKNSYEQDIYNDLETEDFINAEVAETVYGLKNKLKSTPVIWASDDILLIYPLAPIPEQKAVRTSLAVFAPQNPKINFSSSFCMRSLCDPKCKINLIGFPDAICLTSVDIAAFTCNGQHVIHCQIMCKF